VIATLLGPLNLIEAVPELGPLRCLPSVISLKDRDHVLARRVKDLTESLDCWFHSLTPPIASVGMRLKRRFKCCRDPLSVCRRESRLGFNMWRRIVLLTAVVTHN